MAFLTTYCHCCVLFFLVVILTASTTTTTALLPQLGGFPRRHHLAKSTRSSFVCRRPWQSTRRNPYKDYVELLLLEQTTHPHGFIIGKRSLVLARKAVDDDDDDDSNADACDDELFDNDVQRRREKIWNERFEQLLEYKKQNGDLNVPTKGLLGTWVLNNRALYRNKQENRSPAIREDRLKKLEDIGFPWRVRRQRRVESWADRFHQLSAYKERYGNCRVPQIETSGLGAWVTTQRRLYRCKQEGKTPALTDDRERMLRELDFEWKAQFSWDDRFQQLLDYRKENGNCNVPKNRNTTHRDLRKWVTQQRKLYRDKHKGDEVSPLSDDKVKKLEEIGFEWTDNTNIWEERFQELCEYKKKHGTCVVPRSFPTGLGRWVQAQRDQYRNKQQGRQNWLTDDREQKLNEIEFNWSRPQLGWNHHFEQLQQYRSKHGHCDVKQNDGRLGRWVNNQRRHYQLKKKGKHSQLTDDREQLLESVGFRWSINEKRKLK